jgi:transcription elongation factor GreB
MSKAFTREDAADDDAAEQDDAPAAPVGGGKNYITPAGFAALKAEYDQLFAVERPRVVDLVSWAAGNGDRSENGDYLYGKKRLREIDRRMRFLGQRMKAAVIVDPSKPADRARVFFGATVTYADEDERERTVTIVGIDETDASQGKVSWISPIAKALMRSRVGDVATVQTPQGPREVEIVNVHYPAP